MTDLSDFDITKKWPARHPDRIQLYSLPTPNGIKASAMLEETGLAYEPHLVSFGSDDQMTPEFLSLNPNNKIPAMIDPNGPDGKPLGIWESGAILMYLAEKTGQFLSSEPVERYHTIQWLMFQMGGAGPMFGQFGFFHKFAGKEIEDKRPYERYQNESRRLLGVMDKRLQKSEYIATGEYSIADIALWPWIRTLSGFYEAGEELCLSEFAAVNAWLEKCSSRSASRKAVNIPERD
jgi:GST-like protein